MTRTNQAQSEQRPPNRRTIAIDDAPRIAADLAAMLDETAIARDQAGGHAAREREAIRDSGLLLLSIPREYGGRQAGWPLIYETIRTLARADSALAHVYAFHHLQMATLQLYAPPATQARLFHDAVDGNRFWGNALNPLDTGVVATRTDDGWLLDGVKGFASGSVGSDWTCNIGMGSCACSSGRPNWRPIMRPSNFRRGSTPVTPSRPDSAANSPSRPRRPRFSRIAPPSTSRTSCSN